MRLYVATGERLGRIDDLRAQVQPEWALDGSGAQCLAVDPNDPDVVFVGCRGGGLWRSDDGGRSWERLELPERDVFSVAVSAADGAVYAGSEPSRLFCSDDGGRTFHELTALQAIPSRPTWSFPPRPWTSHVRWIAPDPHDADRLLVGIELGGLMVSRDRGASFSDHRPGAQPDVHSLAWHPATPGRCCEVGGGGAAESADGGLTWQPADEGRDRHYTWAVAVDPLDRWYVSAAPNPFRAHRSDGNAGGIIYCREDGRPWTPVTKPLDALPYALAIGSTGELIAGLGNGRILESHDRGDTWQTAPVDAGRIIALAIAEAPGT